MREKRIVGIILVIIGLVLIIFFVSSVQSQSAGRYDAQPLFTLRNCDDNRSHFVYISIIYSNGTQFEESHNLLPGQYVYSQVNTVKSNLDLDFNFTIDTKPSSYIRIHGAPRVTTNFDICDSQKNSPVSVVEFIS
jgi:hypothetical protein